MPSKTTGSQFLRLYHVPASGPEQNSTPESFGLIGATCLGTDLYRLGPRAICARLRVFRVRLSAGTRNDDSCSAASWTLHSSTYIYQPRRAAIGGRWSVRRQKTWLGSKPASRPRVMPWPISWTLSQSSAARMRRSMMATTALSALSSKSTTLCPSQSEPVSLTKPASNPHLQTRCCHPPGGDRTPNQQAVEDGT